MVTHYKSANIFILFSLLIKKMVERVNTGGTKEFVYTGDEKFRDTESTKEFKGEYKKWINRPKKETTKSTLITIIVILIIILLFLRFPNDGTLKKIGDKLNEANKTVYTNSQNNSVNMGNIFDSIKNMLPTTVPNNCPQLDYPITRVGSGSYRPYVLDVKEHEGWNVRGYRLSTIHCYKGDEKGENSDYWYCGDLYVTWGENADYGVIQKTLINTDGTIGDTIMKSFSNIYDENMNFVKTVCGKDPDEIMEGSFKDTMKEMDDFFIVN
ncbi:hypothetical protein CMO89_01705 [Candidatus Woesearchaeota archaeon]|nr:hypothetical protein [Candidatus Woesearchaeota archaeon]